MTDTQMLDFLHSMGAKRKYCNQRFLAVAFRFGELVEENRKLKDLEIDTVVSLQAENQRLQTSLDSTKMCAEATVAGLTEKIHSLEARLKVPT